MRRERRVFGVAHLLVAVALMAGMVVGIRGGSAQDSASGVHPAHLHTGTCDAPGDVVAPLSDISADYLVDGQAAKGAEMVGQAGASVLASVTTVPVALADIIAGGHLIMVHASAEDLQTIVACGNIGGYMLGASQLPVAMSGVGDSGVSGIAVLEDNGAGATVVSVYLTGGAAPDASGGAEGGAAVAVSIKNFAYDPVTIEVAVGTTVTWTNEDAAPHTVTVSGVFDSGLMNQGDTFSYTFDTPGTYDYICLYHPNMKASVVVK